MNRNEKNINLLFLLIGLPCVKGIMLARYFMV